jgi:drug/metabolite transporter (DMT)-like permease
MRFRSGIPEIVTCALTWGSVGIVRKQISLPSSVVALFRVLFGFVVVLAWLAARRQLRTLRPRARPVLLVASGLVLAAHWVAEFEAFRRLDIAPAILIIFLGPVLTAAAAPAVLGERLRAVPVVALAVAFGGIALITVPGFRRIDGAGLAVALVASALFSMLILTAKVLSAPYEPVGIVSWQLGVASLVLLPAMGGPGAREIGRGLALMALLGIVHTGALGILFFRAVRALEAQRLSVLFYLEPAAAVVYAWWWLAERPSAATLAGGALVVLAGLAIIVADRESRATAGVPEPIPGRPTG